MRAKQQNITEQNGKHGVDMQDFYHDIYEN